MPTICKPNSDRITIDESKRLILEALPREQVFDVYVGEDGSHKCVLNEQGCVQAAFIDEDLPGVFQQLGITPRHKYRPSFVDYGGEGLTDDLLYTLAHDEFVKVALLFDVAVSVQDLPPSLSDSVPAEGDAVTPTWSVKRPQRYSGYSVPLEKLLRAAHLEGRPRPSAREVLEAWRNNKPPEIYKVLPDSVDYYDSKGNTKPLDLAAIREAIRRMTSAR